ncbi:MAG: type II secretion system minor pseudopilin GspI [Nevskia sp.]|nr:type II secretion system minor pseudopilin GspI [Nevskia sp.]
MKSTARGFTLLEILVAVTVLAMALSAIIAAGSNYARSSSDLRDKTLALWVAHNRLTEIELQPVWPQLGISNDDVQMGGTQWTWHAEVLGTQDPSLRRIDIHVQKKGDRLQRNFADLSSFISIAGKQATQ